MRVADLETVITLVAEDCCVCGVVFGLSKGHLLEIKRRGTTFYCPNGHSLWYGKNEAERDAERAQQEAAALRAQLDQSEAALTDALHEQRRVKRELSSTRGVLTKTRQRISRGVCPCCHRHFTNVERHMHGQHPEYSGELP